MRNLLGKIPFWRKHSGLTLATLAASGSGGLVYLISNNNYVDSRTSLLISIPLPLRDSLFWSWATLQQEVPSHSFDSFNSLRSGNTPSYFSSMEAAASANKTYGVVGVEPKACSECLGGDSFANEPLESSNLPPGAPVAVVGPQYCALDPVDLSVVRKLFKIGEGYFGVTDVKGNIMLTVERKFFSIGHKRVLLDAAGTPLLTLKQKPISMHRRWEAFKGESTDSKDHLFSVQKSSLFQFRTELDVFFAGNSKENHCDFKIKGSWFKRSYTITLGDTSTIIAQMHRKYPAASFLLGKRSFGVTVYPNVDHAFIVALIVIVEEINRTDLEKN